VTDPRSHADRLDPGGEFRSRLADLEALASSPLRGFLRLLGVKAELEEITTLGARTHAMFADLERAAEVLSPLGWLVFEYSPAETYARAADLVEEGNADEAEALIVEDWNEQDALKLRWSVHRVQNLYRDAAPDSEFDDEKLAAIGHERARLIDEAIESHRAEHYAAAISIALAQMDGIVADFSPEGAVLFSRDRHTGDPRATVTDEVTLAGHPAGLRALARMLTQRCDTTELSSRLLRHGIAHGRELRFDTLTNSTKALAALLGVITWAQPIANTRLAAAAAEHEQRYAGSTERDAHGRRLDRRGFTEAKSALLMAGNFQRIYHERHGRYAESREELLREIPIPDDIKGIETRRSEDGQTYWAWAVPSGYVLAVGGSGGGVLQWQYAGETIPNGGPGCADDWRDPSSDPAHPDW
jgi:hypothetical protein